MEIPQRLKIYQATAIFSMVFAIIGFSYNAWRLEVSEDNNNIRTAAFEVLKELAALELLIYAGHYDKDPNLGNPRKGWVKVGLIVDLSSLINPPVKVKTENLKATWSSHWSTFSNSKESTNLLINDIETIRKEIELTLKNLT